MWIHLCDLEIKLDRNCVISSVLNTIKRFLLLKIYFNTRGLTISFNSLVILISSRMLFGLYLSIITISLLFFLSLYLSYMNIFFKLLFIKSSDAISKLSG